MKEKLQSLLKNSYSPYSHYPVSAILVTKDGREFSGVNVENASYGATICAERNAIASAIAAGYHKGDFQTLYLMTSGGHVSTCCFLCRQVISEMMDADSHIVAMTTTGEVETYTVSTLCPLPFGEDDLV